MTYEKIVDYVQKKLAKADVKNVADHVAIQVDITGEGEGAFYVEINDGKLNIEPYEYYENTAKLIITATDLIALVDGKLDTAKAYADGVLKVEGDVEKAAVMQVLIPAKKAAAKPAAKKAAAPKAAAKPAEKKVAAPKAAAKPVEKKAAAPKAAAKPVEKKAVAPKAAAKPVEKKAVAPKAAAKPVEKKAVAPKAAAKPAEKKVVAPKVAAKPAEKKAVAPKAVVKKDAAKK